MIELTAVAERHLYDLERHYIEKDRYEALRNLRAALFDASDMIERDPGAGIAAPAPYRKLARPGRLWMKAGRYWFIYTTEPNLAITGIFLREIEHSRPNIGGERLYVGRRALYIIAQTARRDCGRTTTTVVTPQRLLRRLRHRPGRP